VNAGVRVGACQGEGRQARQVAEQFSQSALARPRHHGEPGQAQRTSRARVAAAASASRWIGPSNACRCAWERGRAASSQGCPPPGSVPQPPVGVDRGTVPPRRGHGFSHAWRRLRLRSGGGAEARPDPCRSSLGAASGLRLAPGSRLPPCLPSPVEVVLKVTPLLGEPGEEFLVGKVRLAGPILLVNPHLPGIS
jgi:hypothetical protein